MVKNLDKITKLLLVIALFPMICLGQPSTGFKLKTVVIDPGHGGLPGAIHGSYREKDIVLSIGLKLKKMIEKEFPEINLIYTRTKDVDIPLHKRSAIANQASADLFISIHANSSTSPSPRGTETFLMGYDKSKQNLAVAMKENEVVTMEEGYKQKYEGFNPNSAESYIMFSLMQYSFLEQSSLLASLIQKEYSANTSMPNRGVKQAPFLVLWQTSTPSILTEVGFLSNAQDRKYLVTNSGQETIARSIFNAFCKYKEHVEWADKTASSMTNRPPHRPQEVQSAPKEPSKGSNVVFKVQVASSLKPISITKNNFGTYYNRVEVVRVGTRYKYCIGEYKLYKEAVSLQKNLRVSTFKDAFIVAFRDGRQININDAINETSATSH